MPPITQRLVGNRRLNQRVGVQRINHAATMAAAQVKHDTRAECNRHSQTVDSMSRKVEEFFEIFLDLLQHNL